MKACQLCDISNYYLRTRCWKCSKDFSNKCPRCNRTTIYNPCPYCKNEDRNERNYKAEYGKQKSGYNKKPEINRQCLG